jgi:opacity protein-like surface antigen
MGGLKTVVMAGVVTLGAALPVRAADYPWLPPPPVVDEAPAVGAELGTGWYLRGDLGYVDYDKIQDAPYGIPGLPPLENEKLAKTWSIGGGVGYKFNNWFRTDVTVDWRDDARFRATSSRTNYIEGYSVDRGLLETATFLLNGYVDLGLWAGVTPYVGAGIGVAQNRLADYSGQVYCLTPRCGSGDPFANFPLGPQTPDLIPSKTRYNLAWALMAGAAVDVGGGVKVDVGYRYVRFGEARTELDAFGVGTKIKDLDAHEARIGVRYMID